MSYADHAVQQSLDAGIAAGPHGLAPRRTEERGTGVLPALQEPSPGEAVHAAGVEFAQGTALQEPSAGGWAWEKGIC